MTKAGISALSAGSLRVAVLQIAPVFLDAWATWEKLKAMGAKAVSDGAEVLMWGESLIPGYPNWISMDTSEEQEAAYALYWDQAVTLDDSLVADIKSFAKKHKVMIIGGAQIYQTALPKANKLYVTEIDLNAEGDTYFPEINRDDWLEMGRDSFPSQDDKPSYAFVTYSRQ